MTYRLTVMGMLLMMMAACSGYQPSPTTVPQVIATPAACGQSPCVTTVPVVTNVQPITHVLAPQIDYSCSICVQPAPPRYSGRVEREYHRPVRPPPPVAAKQSCSDCAVDLRAEYIGCVDRDGHRLWQYRAENGVVYNMPDARRGPNDRLRLFPNGRIVWVQVSG